MQQGATTSGATVTPQSPEHPQSRPASAPCWPMVNPRVEPQLTGFPVTCNQMHCGLSSLFGITACLDHSTHRDRLSLEHGDLSLESHHGALGSQAHPEPCFVFPSGFSGSAFSCSETQALPVGGGTDLSPALPVSVNSPRPRHCPSFGTLNSSPYPLMKKMTKCSWCSRGAVSHGHRAGVPIRSLLS